MGSAKSRLTWSGPAVAQGEGHAGTQHTTLTMALPCPRNTGFCTSGRHMSNKSGMFGMHGMQICCAEQLCPAGTVTLIPPSYARLGMCTLHHMHLLHQMGPQFQPTEGLGRNSCPCLFSALKQIVPCPEALNRENPDTAACHVPRPGGEHLSLVYRSAVAEEFPP